MTPATWPRSDTARERLLHVDPRAGQLRDAQIRDLPELLAPGDVLVVNDAATLPASLRTREGLELRLLARLRDDASWRAIAFGPGSWRTPTEQRTAAQLELGCRLEFSSELTARVTAIDAAEPRLVELEFEQEGGKLFTALYRAARPIQYSHLAGPLELWHVQNAFASRPWALEMPSAGRPLRFSLLRALRARGVELASVTHAAGISSTGSSALDRRLPMAERYEIPPATAQAIEAVRARGGRVVAAGTTVVRALEARALEAPAGAPLEPGVGAATLVLGPGFVPRVVTGLLTGMHAPGSSHFALLEAFAPRALLERAYLHAERQGYLEHEFGDSLLLL